MRRKKVKEKKSQRIKVHLKSFFKVLTRLLVIYLSSVFLVPGKPLEKKKVSFEPSSKNFLHKLPTFFIRFHSTRVKGGD